MIILTIEGIVLVIIITLVVLAYLKLQKYFNKSKNGKT